ncbi:MAG TPA: SpoIID/LytB domain-containing protein [Calditrichaeota bacterium]|nr:SpoIID/LytB domain-containing protein [Calditrichota bacterium]
MKLLFKIVTLTFLLVACVPRTHLQPEKIPSPNVRVLLNETSRLDSLIFFGTYSLHSEEAKYDFGKKNSEIFFRPLKKGYKIFNPNRIFVFTTGEKISFEPVSDQAYFNYQGRKYKGILTFYSPEKGTLYVINTLPLEEYLQCVVPAEMPSKDKENLEALKAQAICARTYALGRMAKRKQEPYDVYADVRDQVYKGLDVRMQYADMAISATRGDVLMKGNRLASTFYHSTCGGVLEDTIGTLQDTSSVFGRKKIRKDIIGDTFACSISPLYRWQRRFTLRQLDFLLSKRTKVSFFNKELKDTLDIYMKIIIRKRKPSGRIEKLGIQYGDSLLWLENYDIRKFFTDTEKGNLRSNLFLARVEDDTTLVLNGGGYGHGAGMCQWGALYMSKHGFKYFDILVNKYYPGTYLKKVY